jgi:hypothetical protein
MKHTGYLIAYHKFGRSYLRRVASSYLLCWQNREYYLITKAQYKHLKTKLYGLLTETLTPLAEVRSVIYSYKTNNKVYRYVKKYRKQLQKIKEV